MKRYDYIKTLSLDEIAEKAVFKSVSMSGILYISRLTDLPYSTLEEAIADNKVYLNDEVTL